MDQTAQTIASHWKRKPSILFITGAGISLESGVPTYRGAGGLYNDEKTSEGFSIEEIMSSDMLQRDPQLTWKYFRQSRESIKAAKFNRAHEILAEIETEFSRVWTLTQNVDGFHFDAGSRNVIELHGNCREMICKRCKTTVPIAQTHETEIPTCDLCSRKLRPNVVLFGESVPEDALNRLRQQIQIGFSMVICIGTSALFPYIKDAVVRAKKQGNITVEINPQETPLSWVVDYRIPQPATVALDTIWEAYSSECSTG